MYSLKPKKKKKEIKKRLDASIVNEFVKKGK